MGAQVRILSDNNLWNYVFNTTKQTIHEALLYNMDVDQSESFSSGKGYQFWMWTLCQFMGSSSWSHSCEMYFPLHDWCINIY